MTSISPARWRMVWRSWQDCMRKSVSIDTLNAFSIRSAIPGTGRLAAHRIGQSPDARPGIAAAHYRQARLVSQS